MPITTNMTLTTVDVEKKLPGVEPIYYVYDKADRSRPVTERKPKEEEAMAVS